jgi:hypothetical protein
VQPDLQSDEPLVPQEPCVLICASIGVIGATVKRNNHRCNGRYLFHYGRFLDKHYNIFKTGTIQNNHIFKYDDFEGEELTMKCKKHDGVEGVLQNMLKRGTT